MTSKTTEMKIHKFKISYPFNSFYRNLFTSPRYFRMQEIESKLNTYAAQQNGKCLTTELKPACTKIEWECEYGHKWNASPSIIQRHKWCPTCAIQNHAMGLAEMQKIAADNQGRCLSSTYLNQSTPMQWECAVGHTWWTTPQIIKEGHWCPICRHQFWRLTISYLRNFVLNRGGKCLSDKFVDVFTPLTWKCECGRYVGSNSF